MKAKIAQDRRRAQVLAAPSLEQRQRALRSLQRLPRNSSTTRVQNRCLESGSARSVHRVLKLSRWALRQRANAGLIPGLRRSSW